MIDDLPTFTLTLNVSDEKNCQNTQDNNSHYFQSLQGLIFN